MPGSRGLDRLRNQAALLDSARTRGIPVRMLPEAGHPPLIFAAGHDHSLQVLDPRTPEGPRTVLVSGAGSKLTDLTVSPLLRYAATKPGYMTLVFRSNEAVDLYVFASDETEGLQVRGEEETDPPCESEPERDQPSCAEEQADSMRLVYSERLAPPESLPDTSRIAPADTGSAPGRWR